MKAKHSAWAVEAKLWPDRERVLLGVGWFGWPDKPHLQGCRTGLFVTRREAREAMRSVRGTGNFVRDIQPRVVRVTLTISRAR